MKRFSQTRDWLNIAAAMLSTSSDALYKTYGSGELRDHEKVDARIEQLRSKVWELREVILNVRDALDAEDNDQPISAVNSEANEERYQMGLMSEEEQIDYIFGKEDEQPF